MKRLKLSKFARIFSLISSRPFQIHKDSITYYFQTSQYHSSTFFQSNSIDENKIIDNNQTPLKKHRIIVRNLPQTFTAQDMKFHFQSAGNVLHTYLFETHSGKSKGCGVVEFSTSDEAKLAIQVFHLSKLQQKNIFVNPYTPPFPSARSPSAPADPFDLARESTRLRVSNLAWHIRSEDLKSHFLLWGVNPISAVVYLDSKGKSKGRGWVDFQTCEEARAAQEVLNESLLEDRPLYVWVDSYTRIRTPPPSSSSSPPSSSSSSPSS